MAGASSQGGCDLGPAAFDQKAPCAAAGTLRAASGLAVEQQCCELLSAGFGRQKNSVKCLVDQHVATNGNQSCTCLQGGGRAPCLA